MSRYLVTFHGRAMGAIGVLHACNVKVEADSPEAALLATYIRKEESASGVLSYELTDKGRALLDGP